MADAQADPEFLALSQRARDRIDSVFDRAADRAAGGSRKRRKLNPQRGDASGQGDTYQNALRDEDAGGGFVPDDEEAGGFVANDDMGGGFLPDEGDGGFIPDDDDEENGGGGFVPDDEDGGGFLPDNEPATPRTSASTPSRTSRGAKVPLKRVPILLSYLNLPADDDVLDVFRASASGWADDDEQGGASVAAGRRRRMGEEEDGDRDSKLFVERKDFRAVCAALLAGDEGDLPMSDDQLDGGDVDMETEGAKGDDDLGPGRRRQRPSARSSLSSGSEDYGDDDGDGGFEPTMSEHSSLSSLSSDSEYGASRKKSRATKVDAAQSKGKGTGKGKSKARATATDTDASAATTPKRKGRGKKDAVIADDGPIKLNSRQKEMVRALWEMLKPPQMEQQQQQQSGGYRGKRGGSNPNVLGRDEVKAWVRQLGEMWTEDEITDMVSLFSTQHEQRGLSFEDFGQVMVRGRIV